MSSDIQEDTYFNNEYRGASLWYGLGIVNALANFSMLMFLPYFVKDGKKAIDKFNQWTQMAWGAMIGGNYMWYYFIGSVWLFSFIRKPFPQKALFWSIIVG